MKAYFLRTLFAGCAFIFKQWLFCNQEVGSDAYLTDLEKEAAFISIVVNGEEFQISTSITVEQWLEQSGLKGKHLVVELNERILNQQDWASEALQDGDRLEIVTFVGGG